MTAWDPIGLTNTVTVGPVTYQNLPVVSPVGLTEGLVLLAKGPAGYIIMGMLAGASSSLLAPIRYRRLKPDLSVPTTTFADAGLLNFQLATNTEYALDGMLSYLSGGTVTDMKFAWTGPANMAVRWSMGGVNNATSYSVNNETIYLYGDANFQTVQGAAVGFTCRPAGWFATTDTPGLLQLRVALSAAGVAGTLQEGSWLRISDLGTSTNADIHIKQYACTASRSYDDSGNPIGVTDQDNNVYQGTFPDRSFGNERSILIFPGSTIRSDLAGALVLNARLYLYCFKAEEVHGSLVEPRTEPNTSVPATYAGPSSNDATSLHDAWPVPGWFSVECLYQGGPDGLLNGILAGDNAIGLPPTTFGLAATGYRGYGFSASFRPYLEVTYAV